MRGSVNYPQSRRAAGMAGCSGNKPRNERPVRGDNRTGQTIWRLGWMGARAKYGLDGEKFSLPQVFCLARAAQRSTSLRVFFGSPRTLTMIYCAAVPFAPATAGFSDATAGRFATGTAAAAAA